MLNNSPEFEKLLEKHNINFDVGRKLSKKIINKYTSVDKYGYLEVCYGGNCYETNLVIDEDFLRDELNYNWKRISYSGGVFDYLISLMGEELGFSYDFSIFFIANFLCPEIYDVYYKPMESDNINESIRNYKDNENIQKKYLEHIYNDLIKNTKWRDASYSNIDLYNGKCKNIQIWINWASGGPSFNGIPDCIQNYLTDVWGLTYEEIESLFWGRYDKHIINMRLQRRDPPSNINESIDKNKKYEITKEDLKKLLYHYTVDMGYDKESAIEDLKDLIRWFNSLPNKIKLYRLLYLNDRNEINYDELGTHYSNNKRDLIDNHYNKGSIYGDMGEEAFLITVESPKNKIDFIETLTNNILFPNEHEITLEDKGRGVEFVKVEKL